MCARRSVPRVVLDTVVLVRGLINPFGAWGRLIFARARDYRLVVSPPLLEEYLEVTARPALVRKFKSLPEHRRDVLVLLSQAEVIEFDALPTFERDPDDAHLLATAVAGDADYLISGDNDPLDLGEYEGIRILTAGAFLNLLDQAEG